MNNKMFLDWERRIDKVLPKGLIFRLILEDQVGAY